MLTRLIIRKHFPWRVVGLTIAGCVLAAGLVIFITLRMQQHWPIPAAIARQVSSPVFLPREGVVLDQTSYKFDPSQKVLSFTGRLPDGQLVTFAEQPTPEPFSDIPNYYAQFLQTLFEYQAFDGLNGTIYLTHPKGAGQAAVMSAKGTLIFARVAHDEPQAVLALVFNSMQVYTH